MKIFAFCLSLIVWIAAAADVRCTRYEQMNTDNEKHLKQASELINAFSTEREPERLREAALALEEVDLRRVYDVTLRHKQRSECLTLWLTIIATLDKNLDPTFDPNEAPPLKVSPPPLKDGTVLMPGADPSLIDDPKARAEYEKAIKENREKQEKALIQPQLLELNERLPAKVDAFIRNIYTTSDADRSEVQAAIDKIIENETRRQFLYRSIERKTDE